MRTKILCVTLSMLLSTLTQAVVKLNDEIEEIRAENDGIGLVGWSIAGNGSMCSLGAAGERCRWSGEKMKLRGDSRHVLGSVTKSITATILAILIENGEIESWSTTIKELVPTEYLRTSAYRDVQLRELLSHSSGIPRDPPVLSPCWWTWPLQLGARRDLRKMRRICAIDALKTDPLFPPGSNFSYSNWGYVVAGYIIEEVTGKLWEKILPTILFEPLGIKLDTTDGSFDSYIGAPPDSDIHYWGHIPILNIPCNPEFPIYRCDTAPVIGPAARFSGPVAAMAQYFAWHIACHNGDHTSLLSQESCRTLHRPVNWTLGVYGLGWYCRSLASCKHGGTNGVTTYEVKLDFAGNRAYVAFTNQYSFDAEDTYEIISSAIGTLEKAEGDCSAPIPSSVYL
jgi:D-alanyl-D-alanine carboxypeptidase